ncbi:MAG: alpha/beta fold hydrolase [Pseudomonadota bacterium]
MAIVTAAEWEKRGRIREVAGRRLFVIDEGPRDAPVIAVLHGFPSASYDFWRVLPQLAERHRVVIHDHLGFGFSEKPLHYGYSIIDQTTQALLLWQSLGLRHVHVLAHDYGCSIATELFHRHSHRELSLQIDSATLVNSGLYYDMAGLRLAQHLLRLKWTRPVFSRLAGRGMYKLNMRRLWGTPGRELDAELDELWAMTVRDGGKPVLGRLSHYLEERRWIHRDRWRTAISAFNRPVHVLWGDRDPVGVPAIAVKLDHDLQQPTLSWLPGVGHYPMIEAPAAFATAALRFIDSQPAR